MILTENYKENEISGHKIQLTTQQKAQTRVNQVEFLP